jgi:hypothetical protein
MERAGFTTITVSPIPELTAAVGVPRVAGIGFPPGRPFGQPGDSEGQRAVLRAALEVVETAGHAGTVVDLPFEWPESPSRVRSSPLEPPPIVTLLKRKPWLVPKLFSRDVPRRPPCD